MPRPSDIYADEEELAAMEICHPICIEILKNFLESMPERTIYRALDVAGGDGRLSTSLLTTKYNHVDLFDACSEAVAKAKLALKGLNNFGYIEQANMETYRWRFYYSGIFMVWCVGYL